MKSFIIILDSSERVVTCLLDLGPSRPRSEQVRHGVAGMAACRICREDSLCVSLARSEAGHEPPAARLVLRRYGPRHRRGPNPKVICSRSAPIPA